MANATNLTPLPIDSNHKPLQGIFRNMVSGTQSVATAGTAVQLISSQTECKSVDVTADAGNTDVILVGGSGVVAASGTRKGVPIFPGNTYTFKITDVSNVWIDAVHSGDKVVFNYFY